MERRAMLSALTWVGPPGGIWDLNDVNHAYWSNGVTNMLWQNGSDAVFPVGFAGAVAVSDSAAGATKVWANSITFEIKFFATHDIS
jgi:hypothetical protein